MIAKNHRRNTNFQILYFLIGSCHTIDGAYALLCELFEERNDALNLLESQNLRKRIHELEIKTLLESKNEIQILEGRARLSEMKAKESTMYACIEAAKAELAFIKECMKRLEGIRKFKELPLPEAHEAAQEEEWMYELMQRADDAIASGHKIAPDQWAAMRMHPQFKTKIFPFIQNKQRQPDNHRLLIKPFKLNLLLEGPKDGKYTGTGETI